MLALLVQHFGGHLGLHLTLALRLYAGTGLGPVDALANVHAATVASTDEVSPELLLAVALVESRFDPHWVSRVEVGAQTSRREQVPLLRRAPDAREVVGRMPRAA